jgi:hypothetical protein
MEMNFEKLFVLLFKSIRLTGFAAPTKVIVVLNRLASILLLICFAGLGSGAMKYLHDLQHDAEDAVTDALRKAAGLPIEHHEHDETNCPVHAQLHMQFTATSYVAIIICLGLFVAFLTLLEKPLIPRQLPARIDCRGPPVLSLFKSNGL